MNTRITPAERRRALAVARLEPQGDGLAFRDETNVVYVRGDWRLVLDTSGGYEAVLEVGHAAGDAEGVVALSANQARDVGVCLLHWAGNDSLWQDYTWCGPETLRGGHLQALVEDGVVTLGAGDADQHAQGMPCAEEVPLAWVQDLAVRLLAFAGPDMRHDAGAVKV